MVTLEQVSKRVFGDPNWFVKTMVGALILFIPGANIFAMGYVYRMASQGRRGDLAGMPDWDDWGALWFDGLRFLVLLLVLAVAPIVIGWLLTMPLRWTLLPIPGYWMLRPLLYLPLVPGLLLAGPLTAAGLYRFMRREDFRDIIQIPILLRMVIATKGRLVIPTLAYLGLCLVLFGPFLPYAIFTGGVVYFYFAALIFHHVERNARAIVVASVVARR